MTDLDLNPPMAVIVHENGAVIIMAGAQGPAGPAGPAGPGGGGSDYILVRDEKLSSEYGGSFVLGAWRDRDLTTIVSDAGGHASLLANVLTLAAGIYIFKARLPGYQVSEHVGQLYNIDDTIEYIGGTARTNSVSATVTDSFVEGRFEITESKTFKLRHQSKSTWNTAGFGVRSGMSGVPSIYSSLELWKEG